MGTKKLTSYALILLFSFFSAFAMNVILVDITPICAEESVSESDTDIHVGSPQDGFLFLDEIHPEESAIFAPIIFPVHFSTTQTLYRDPYLGSLTEPPQV